MEDIIGSIVMFGADFIPNSNIYLPCDGRLLPISNGNPYIKLFSIIGNMYGGDGKTNFALPDMRGRFPLGAGQGNGLTNRTVGEKGGVETVSLTEAQIPQHNHAYFASTLPQSFYSPLNHAMPTTTTPFYSIKSSTDSLVQMDSGVIGISGLGQGHNNMNPFLGITFMICYDGIYPNR
ncbi:phage tail protein [Emticicia sp. 17c]|uniref:phage tail protein n=1 Tax=Emticicia sp. 17c TaxID=3127704 RepID=UPI00301D2673